MQHLPVMVVATNQEVSSDVALNLSSLPYVVTESRLDDAFESASRAACLLIIVARDFSADSAVRLNDVLNLQPASSAILIVDMSTVMPDWIHLFRSERLGFYATENIDEGLTSYVRAFVTLFM